MSVAVGSQPARACLPGQTQVSWNKEGPAGPPGGDSRSTLYTKFCNAILWPGADPVDVMALKVPAGSWTASVSIQAGALGDCGSEHPDAGLSLSGDYDCVLIGGGGHPASSLRGEFRTLAWSEPLYLQQPSARVVRCQLFAGSGDGATLSVGDLVVTPVRGIAVQ